MSADLRVENYGSVHLLRPLTEAGETWIEVNVQVEGWQRFGGAFACEPRFTLELVEGAREAGLEVE